MITGEKLIAHAAEDSMFFPISTGHQSLSIHCCWANYKRCNTTIFLPKDFTVWGKDRFLKAIRLRWWLTERLVQGGHDESAKDGPLPIEPLPRGAGAHAENNTWRWRGQEGPIQSSEPQPLGELHPLYFLNSKMLWIINHIVDFSTL